jgi:hypothetical protein
MNRTEQGAIPAVPGSRKKSLPFTGSHLPKATWITAGLSVFLLLSLVSPIYGRKAKKIDYGPGFSSEVLAPETDVLQAVQEVVDDGMIQGSKEYNKDKYVEKASAAPSSSLFPEWTGPGHAFYKVRTHVLAPVNFKDSNDEGTLAVRYVVESKSPQQTIVRVDAVFVEDFRGVVHRSNGSVETAEYKDIQDHVDAIELQKKQAAEAERHRQEVLAKRSFEQRKAETETSALTPAQTSSETLEQHVENLRHRLERVVKTSGAQLKSAPFASATNLQSLKGGAEVVILIVTPYWYGVETEEGQHGWISHSQLEPLP